MRIAIDEFNRIAERYPQSFHGWKLEFSDRSVMSAGWARYGKRIVTVSTWLAHAPDEDIIDTVRHECAHVLSWEGNQDGSHGPLWKEWAVLLGAKPKAHYPEELMEVAQKVNPPKYEVYCPPCDFTLCLRHRKAHRPMIHPDCGSLVEYRPI